MKKSGCVFGDASAALGIIHRKGFGKLRNLNTNFLRVQEKAAKKEVEYKTAEGSKNIADALTKALVSETLTRHTTAAGNGIPIPDGDKMVTYVGAAPCSTEALKKAHELGRRLGCLQRWVRTDMGSRTLRTTLRGGPAW